MPADAVLEWPLTLTLPAAALNRERPPGSGVPQWSALRHRDPSLDSPRRFRLPPDA